MLEAETDFSAVEVVKSEVGAMDCCVTSLPVLPIEAVTQK